MFDNSDWGAKIVPRIKFKVFMNQREIVLANISEAREELEAVEKSLLDPDYGEIELKMDLEHAYHHLNYAWNIRNESEESLSAHSAVDFTRWSKFPMGEIQEYE